MGSEDHAAASVVRSAARALAGAASALLAVRLGATAADHAARLGRCRAGAPSSELCDHCLVDQCLVDLGVEEHLGQVDHAQVLAGLGEKRCCYGHCYLPLFFASVLRTTTSAFRAPGSGPLMSSRLRSESVRRIVIFLTVTRSLPMRPAMLVPLKTLPGYVPAPMEPGCL